MLRIRAKQQSPHECGWGCRVKIAILGWGSLVWNPGDLAISHDGWHSDGPLLPIEFARISGHGNAPPRLTLVLRADAEYVQTQWAQSSHEELARAIDNLAAREKTVEAKIGYLKSGSDSMGDRSRLTALAGSDIAATEGTATAANVLDRIDWWREQQGLDAVIWTDLGSNFEERHGSLSRQNVVAYLRSLSARGFAAEEYVRRAPRQTRTKIRRLLEHDLGWLPTPASRIGPDDPSFQKEWAECRTTIGRLDTILEDLRKLGFSFITALLTAGAILSFLGIQSVDKVPVPPAPTRAAPSTAAAPASPTPARLLAPALSEPSLLRILPESCSSASRWTSRSKRGAISYFGRTARDGVGLADVFPRIQPILHPRGGGWVV